MTQQNPATIDKTPAKEVQENFDDAVASPSCANGESNDAAKVNGNNELARGGSRQAAEQLDGDDGDQGGGAANSGTINNPDPFDPGRFRVSQDFATAAVKSELTEIAVGKPGKQEFIRVHPSPDYRLDAAIIEYERSTYLVVPELANGALRDQVKGVTLFTTQNTQHATYLWPVALPKDGRTNSWTDSARELALKAMTQTIQINANHGQKAQRYDAVVPVSKPPEPEWPSLTFRNLLQLAFGGHVIDSLDHPVARRLLGVTFD